MKTIPLSKGKFAVVDDCDYDMVSSFGSWCLSGYGYAIKTQRTKPKTICMHRVILGLSSGDGLVADHINGDRLDNRRDNLRVVNRKQSQANILHKPSKSGYKGVQPMVKSILPRWQATILGRDGKPVHLGTFDNPRSAAIAYDFAALVLRGHHAAINGILPCHRKYASRCLIGG